jgi:predicted nucleic acid-binding protein
MIKSALLDSSVWVANYLQKDIHHLRARKIIQSLIQNNYKLVIPLFVYIETINVLVRENYPIAEIEAIKNEMKIFEIIDLDQNKFLRLFHLYLTKYHIKTLDFAIIICHFLYQATKTITFDRKMNQVINNLINDNYEKGKTFSS